MGANQLQIADEEYSNDLENKYIIYFSQFPYSKKYIFHRQHLKRKRTPEEVQREREEEDEARQLKKEREAEEKKAPEIVARPPSPVAPFAGKLQID